MSNKLEDIKRDIEEIESFIPQAKRQKTKDILGIELRKLQTELISLKEKITDNETSKSDTTPAKISEIKCYESKITNYAWDQSEKFVKLYVSISNVQTLAPEAVTCTYTLRSINLRILGLENKNLTLTISNLLEDINPEKSYVKVKTDMVVVFLAKEKLKHWSHVTGIERKITDAKSMMPDSRETSDPESSLMNLMKKMYTDGDDEMKRTIAKAWTENQDKKNSGDSSFPSFPMS